MTVTPKSMQGAPPEVPTPTTTPHSFGFRPGVDLDKLNRLAGQLAAETAAEILERAR